MSTEVGLGVGREERIEASLERRCRQIFGSVGAVHDVRQISTGWECEVWTFDLTATETGRKQPLILRLYCGLGGAAKAENEAAVLGALYDEFPVPKVLTSVENDPFGRPHLIMERIDGPQLGDQIAGGRAWQRDAIIDEFSSLLVRLHRLDVTQAARSGIAQADIGHFLDVASAFIEDRELADFVPLVQWLSTNRPGDELLVLTHHDFHPWNVLVDRKRGPIVIDWTGAEISDRRFDLGWTLLLAESHLGSAAAKLILDGYQHRTSKAEALEWFMVAAAGRRLADIYVSLRDGPEAMGMRPGAELGSMRNPITWSVPAKIVLKHTGLTINPP